MHRFGSRLVAIGMGWFVRAALVFMIFLMVDAITGAVPPIPDVWGGELTGGLLYFGVTFGIYLGSWTFMAAGMALIFLGTLIGTIRQKPSP